MNRDQCLRAVNQLMEDRRTQGKIESNRRREEIGIKVPAIGEKERQLREKQDKEALADRASRTLGILLYARRMDSAELLGLYTTLRLGAAMKLLDGITPTMADRMLIESMPGTLTLTEGLENDSAARDKARAQTIRRILENKK